jgi:hypothetical protein
MAYFRFFLTHPRVLSFGVLLTLFSSFGQTFLISIFVPRRADGTVPLPGAAGRIARLVGSDDGDGVCRVRHGTGGGVVGGRTGD